MDTGCKPTSVRFVGLLKSSTRGRIGTHALCIHLPYVNFWKAQPFSFISKHLPSFEDWGGHSQEVVTVVCSKLRTFQGRDSRMQSTSVL